MMSALFFALLLAAPAPGAGTVERRLTLMGTEARLQLLGPSRSEALAASERVVRALLAAERRLSTWTQESELARLNAAALDRTVVLSPELSAELAAAFVCRARTGGAFDPEVGRLVAAWGLRDGGRWPSPAEISRLVDDARRPGLELDPKNQTAVRRSDRTLEEGAWGKGAALDRALAAVGPEVSAFLDLGGQLIFSPGLATTVALADPRDRQRQLLEIEVRGGSVSTSGNGERGLLVGGRLVGHLLDPRSGRPAADFGSVTVWAETGLVADCLSTGLAVLGPDGALAFAAAHPEVEVVVVEMAEGGRRRARASAGLAGRVRPLDDDLEFAIWKAPERPVARNEGGAGAPAPEAIGPDSSPEP
jgi:thiamine biosynthesis lipoprotein